MSKSYKKNPIVKGCGYGRDGKKIANRRVRRITKDSNEILKGNMYKRIFDSWEINDVILRWTKEEAINYYNERKKRYENKIGKNYEKKIDEGFFKKYPTLEFYLKEVWERGYKRK